MTSFYSPTPPTFPFPARRKSSSASTRASMESHIYSLGEAPPHSSPLSSSLHLSRRNIYMESQVGDLDHLDGVLYAQQTKLEDECYTHSLPHTYQPLPSLMTKFAAHAFRSDPPLSYSQSPFYVPHTTRFYPLGDSAVADDREEYDLESMDIHIRETYFATSAERGRWLSSPIAPRVRSQATPPMRGHSSPAKGLPDKSPPRQRFHRTKINCSVDQQSLPISSEDLDEDVRYSSPLPPSSPLTSPISFSSDCEDSTLDPHSNADDFHSFTGTPELSMSSSACTSPIQPTRTPTPLHEAPAIVPTHQSPAGPAIPCHTSPYFPQPIDLHIHETNPTHSEPDPTLSPLSQFELDLPEVEPPKLPLSDTVNKPYPGQNTAGPSVAADATGSQDGLHFVQTLDSICEPLDAPLNPAGRASWKRKSKRREPCVGSSAHRRTRKRGDVRSESPLSEAGGGNEAESRLPDSVPLSKRSKVSHCRDDLESREKQPPKRGGKPKLSGSTSSTARGHESESECQRDKKTRKLEGSTQLQQPTPVPLDGADAEFHASLTGMLIEALATSRATCMDASTLHLVLTQAHPYLATERSKEELVANLAAVLEAGRARCGMFEKVDCSGERSRHKALESRWFYVPERDEDPERASLISAIMPRQKRSETKKYKQYYYRPLDKISKWDPEDAS